MAVALLFATFAHAQSGGWSLIEENDALAPPHSDKDYTQGVKLTRTGTDLRPLRWLMRESGGVISCGTDPRCIGFASLSLGQNIYTPRDITVVGPEDDRPYAGWLYTEGRVTLNRGNRLHEMDAQLGLTGRYAGGETIMNGFHRLQNEIRPHTSRPAKGWRNQIPTEAGVVLHDTHMWKTPQYDTPVFGPLIWLFGDKVDAIAQTNVYVGNVMDIGDLAVTVRSGSNIGPAEFVAEPIAPTDIIVPPDVVAKKRSMPEPDYGFSLTRTLRIVEIYGFGTLAGRVVGRNIFVQGDDSPGVPARRLLRTWEVGGVVRWPRFEISYRRVARNSEMAYSTRRHRYGSVMFSIIPSARHTP